MEQNSERNIIREIHGYRKKYYLNRVFKGSIFMIAISITILLLLTLLEFTFQFGKEIRALLLLSGIISVIYTFYIYLFQSIAIISGYKKGYSDEEFAKMIGHSIPDINDKLLNFLQLSESSGSDSLASAGKSHKYEKISRFRFRNTIKWSANRKYLKYAISPITVLIILLWLKPAMIMEPADRIIHFNNEYLPSAPFEFYPDLPERAFRNEDVSITLQILGNSVPESAYLLIGKRKIKLDKLDASSYNYTLSKIQNKKVIRFEAAGFLSREYEIEVSDRPALEEFQVELSYPSYTGLKSESISNNGNLSVPEGTVANWIFNTNHTSTVNLKFQGDSSILESILVSEDIYVFNKILFNSDNYSVILKNNYSINKDNILYNIIIKKDEFPQISLKNFQDTTLYNLIVLAGNISDDYGLSRLVLKYSLYNESGTENTSGSIPIHIKREQQSQAFYYQWFLDSIKPNGNEQLQYYLEVWDNDGIHGSKSTRSTEYTFRIPGRSELLKEIDKSNLLTENQASKSMEIADELSKKIEEAERKLKEKRKIDWEDEKIIEEILNEKEELEDAIEKLQELNQQNTQKRERFSPQDNELRERAKRLQELMEDIMDPETKRLYEELKRLMEEESGVEQIRDKMEQINRRQKSVEKELERAKELYKRLLMEYEISESIEELRKLSIEEKKLAEDNLSQLENTENNLEKQLEINERFKDIKESIDRAGELNQELDNPEPFPDQSNLEKSIEEKLKESSSILEEIENNDSNGKQNVSDTSKKQSNTISESFKNQQRNKAGEQQNKASEEMQRMSDELDQLQQGMEMQMMTENLEDLRNIIHDLLKLSFDQEKLFTQFSEVNEIDPRFKTLSQNQLKIRDDSKILEDSLISLSKRLFQLQSMITEEVSNMNEHIENSMDALKERNKPQAIGEQKFSMSSMNNLALLLDDLLDQIMNNMQQKSGSKSSKNNPQQSQSLSELQKQLNEKIQDLKESGKEGKELSEELAKLAAEQARIREALKEMQERMEQTDPSNSRSPGSDIPGKMEETETDLVNKRLTEEMIRRQKDILSRLLEAENALRERELDDERKGETANNYKKTVPKAFEDYLKQKEKEVEMLKTLPPRLFPWYKNEVSEYFKRLGNEENN